LDYLEKSIEQTRKTSGENWIHFLDLFYAGIVNQELNRHKEAIQYFDKALKSYTNFSDAKYYKALSLFRTGQLDLAEKTLSECELEFKKGYTINIVMKFFQQVFEKVLGVNRQHKVD
jgi:tetratricopeptide (TPR) repeat protein